MNKIKLKTAKFRTSLFCAFLLASLSTFSQHVSVSFEYVDPLQKVFPESNYFTSKKAHADVARGEFASFQFAIRSNVNITDLRIEVESPNMNDKQLKEIKKGFIDYVRVDRTNPDPSKDIYTPSSGFFPDPIMYVDNKNVSFGTTQPIWISVKIPKESQPGLYNGKVNIIGKAAGEEFVKTQAISIEVFEPVIDGNSLWVTNWFFLDRLSYLNNNQPVEPHSELFWELSRVLAKTLGEYQQNVAMISPFDHTLFIFEKDEWSFDFSNFNKLVQIFIDEGVIGRLEGGHLGARIDGGWSSPFGLFVPKLGDDAIDKELMPLDSPITKKFYSSFLPAFMQNIKDNGWQDEYVQHIADEPIGDNVNSYIEISKFIKTIIPEIRIIEATHTHSLENKVDVWVPQMNFLKEGLDFYKERQLQGDEIWYYTCLSPKGEYANRFIEQPLIKTRLLHWVNYKYNITGYLHWGFNHWGSSDGHNSSENPYEDVSGMIVSSGNVLPGGDSWIVYPGYKTIYPSIRLEAMRDGINDYELLRMFSEKFPDEAKEIVNSIVYGFEHYDTHISDFRSKRRYILERLSE